MKSSVGRRSGKGRQRFAHVAALVMLVGALCASSVPARAAESTAADTPKAACVRTFGNQRQAAQWLAHHIVDSRMESCLRIIQHDCCRVYALNVSGGTAMPGRVQ